MMNSKKCQQRAPWEAMSEIRASTINAKNIDDGSTRKCCRRSVSTHHQHKKYRRWALWEATPEIRARPPLTQKTSTTGPMPSWGGGSISIRDSKGVL
jgi:hypothetical protein